MVAKYKVELHLNGFVLGTQYNIYRITGIKWCLRLGREYQRKCQNVSLEIHIYSRELAGRRPQKAVSGFELIETHNLKPDKKQGGSTDESK